MTVLANLIQERGGCYHRPHRYVAAGAGLNLFVKIMLWSVAVVIMIHQQDLVLAFISTVMQTFGKVLEVFSVMLINAAG